MTQRAISPNRHEILYVADSVTSNATYLTATGHALDVNIIGASGSLPSMLINGQQTVSTSAAALSPGVLTQGVILGSLSTNTVSIFVGTAAVTTATGYELQPGASVGVAVADTSDIFVICASSSPVVTWLGS